MFLGVLISIAVDGSRATLRAQSLPASGESGDRLSNARTLVVPHVTSPSSLASVSNGGGPDAVVWDFRQNQPGDGTPVSLPTVAHVSYDDRNLYVVFECADDPANIRARMARREDISDDDQVLVFLDTFRDRRRAYVFQVNPLGNQRDGVLTEGQGTDYTYDTVWRSDAKLTDNGFIVLVTIPFNSLRFSNADAQTWGIALGRYIPRTSEYSYWPYITTRVDGFVNQMAVLEGITKVSPGHNVQLVPYATFTGSRYLDTSVPAFVRSDEGRGGLDSKVVLHDALTVDATVNPDFSQVESDDPQVTVNKRFAVYFPEKRPFFIENAGFFATPENILFTRRIADPEFGGRLTGKVGGWAVGMLLTDDRAEGAGYAADSPFADRIAGIGALRVQREIGNESYVGMMVTDRSFASESNRILSADARLKLNPNWVLTAQAIRSDDETLSGTRTNGSEMNASLTETGRHATFKASYLERSPDFNATLGFIQRVNIRQASQYLGYYWRPASGPLMSFGPALSTYVDWDYTRRLQDWYVLPQLDFYFRREYGMSLSRTESYELFEGVDFREYLNTISAYSSRAKQLSLTGSVSWGTVPNYSPPQGVVPFLGDSRTASFGLTFRPARRLRVDEIYYYSGFQTRGAVASGAAAANVFTNHLARTKIHFQFTGALSLRAIVDYNSLVPTPSLIRYSLSKQLTGDLLLTYLVNPFTAFYVGYTEGYQNLAIDASSPPSLRLMGTPSTLASRQVFVKMSYRFGL